MVAKASWTVGLDISAFASIEQQVAGFLDSEGVELVNSDGPGGNIGCPISAEECAWFVDMIRKSAVKNPDETSSAIAAALEEYASGRR